MARGEITTVTEELVFRRDLQDGEEVRVTLDRRRNRQVIVIVRRRVLTTGGDDGKLPALN